MHGILSFTSPLSEQQDLQSSVSSGINPYHLVSVLGLLLQNFVSINPITKFLKKFVNLIWKEGICSFFFRIHSNLKCSTLFMQLKQENGNNLYWFLFKRSSLKYIQDHSYYFL